MIYLSVDLPYLSLTDSTVFNCCGHQLLSCRDDIGGVFYFV
nr:MAG TPA: hypothetical protein [Crassvirales sp.]